MERDGLPRRFAPRNDSAAVLLGRTESSAPTSCHSEPVRRLAWESVSQPAVDALTARLAQDGYPVVSPPRVTGDGYYESCVLDSEGTRVEITG